MKNYFSTEKAAERYARARPYFHPLVIAKMREYLGLSEPVTEALDVACGTGLSALALAEIAHHVVGTDISGGMLAQAPVHTRITFLQAPAEKLPLAGDAFDLITVALAFHWLDRGRFLGEAHRLLRKSGWLVIYNNGFSGTMLENPAFVQWNNNIYLTRYPSPTRSHSFRR